MRWSSLETWALSCGGYCRFSDRGSELHFGVSMSFWRGRFRVTGEFWVCLWGLECFINHNIVRWFHRIREGVHWSEWRKCNGGCHFLKWPASRDIWVYWRFEFPKLLLVLDEHSRAICPTVLRHLKHAPMLHRWVCSSSVSFTSLDYWGFDLKASIWMVVEVLSAAVWRVSSCIGSPRLSSW